MDFPLVWAEVDLEAIAHNVRELRRITDPGADLMAVVKANAYGHGVIEVTRKALESGADTLGVARIEEGIELRKAGFNESVLIFGYTPPALARKLIAFDLTQTVWSYKTAQALSDVAVSSNKQIKVHLKVDTGMGRLGLLPDYRRPPETEQNLMGNAIRDVESISSLAGLTMEGVYTHFATADSSDKAYAEKQFKIFIDFLNELRRAGMNPPLCHAANSAAIIDMPETHLHIVRAGIAIYGLYPSDQVNKRRIALKPAMTLKSKIVHLKKVPPGFKVSYGSTYQTPKSTTIASIPVGYADGFNRLLSSRGHMLVRGRRAPIVGRVCMDQTMLDVGHIPDVALEDEVVIFGRQEDASITVDEIAATLNTINYEIVSSLTARVPRIYPKLS
ncbi:MAG: alanine racemase [Deltaproteobacteria bacterium]|nr:alanine racemase [Deltaproteobacteria bacterium]MBW2014842.1 alanine racemase [Deltaproteobacteria bacterium]